MNFHEYSAGPQSFGRKSRAVTPDDDNDLPGGPVKAIILTTAGSVSFLPMDNPDEDPVTLEALLAGHVAPFLIRRVLATGTTATVRTIEG